MKFLISVSLILCSRASDVVTISGKDRVDILQVFRRDL